jgi:hypothetical protein
MKQAFMATMSQGSRAELIGQIATVIQRTGTPKEARQAGLTLIGWLARRMPQDACDSRTTQ